MFPPSGQQSTPGGGGGIGLCHKPIVFADSAHLRKFPPLCRVCRRVGDMLSLPPLCPASCEADCMRSRPLFWTGSMQRGSIFYWDLHAYPIRLMHISIPRITCILPVQDFNGSLDYFILPPSLEFFRQHFPLPNFVLGGYQFPVCALIFLFTFLEAFI